MALIWSKFLTNENIFFSENTNFLLKDLDITYKNADSGVMYYFFYFGILSALAQSFILPTVYSINPLIKEAVL